MSNPYDKMSDDREAARRRREGYLEDLRSVVERIIDDAQAKGAFENLPGRGKPLQLDAPNPYAAGQEMAYKLLKDNDYTLPWIANRQEMLARIATFRADIAGRWHTYHHYYQHAPAGAHRTALESEWRRIYAELQERLQKLNKEITALNLTIPVSRLEVLKLNLDRELAQLGGGRELGGL